MVKKIFLKSSQNIKPAKFMKPLSFLPAPDKKVNIIMT